MKKLTIFIIILALIYFIAGYVAVTLNFFDRTQYFNLSAIIGGIASVSGLLSLVLTKIKKKDIEKIGVEYLKDVINAADELKEKEKELSKKEKDLTQKEKEIKQLEIKRKELEYLVQKSSMLIFLKEQHSKIHEKIVDIINSRELRRLYEQLESTEMQITALDSEINQNPEVEFLKKVMKEISAHKVVVKRSNFKDKINTYILNIFDDEEALIT